MLRYALLWHDCSADYRDGPHADLMLESPDMEQEHRLRTWSLLSLPNAWAESLALADSYPTADLPIVAELLADHRARYLEYEGPISAGRGSVRQLATGPMRWVESHDQRAIAELLAPGDLQGTLHLQRTAGESQGVAPPSSWLLNKWVAK